MSAVLAALAVGLLVACLLPAPGGGGAPSRRLRECAERRQNRERRERARGPAGPEPVRLRIAQADAAREHLTRVAALLRSGATPTQAFAALAADARADDAKPDRGGRPEASRHRGAGGVGGGAEGAERAEPLRRDPLTRVRGRRDAAKRELATQLEAAWGDAATSVALALGAGVEIRRREPAAHGPGAPGLGASWSRLRWVCGMAARTGAPLAPLLERLAEDAAATADALRARQAGAAAAGTTRKILAWLPVGGLLLAQALGARPVEVLVGSVPGRITAGLGCAFWLAAFLWSRRVIALPEEERSTPPEPGERASRAAAPAVPRS